MWRTDQPRNRTGQWLTVIEIIFIVIIVGSLAAFIWKTTGISYLDGYLQLAVVGGFSLLIVFASNYLMSKRW